MYDYGAVLLSVFCVGLLVCSIQCFSFVFLVVW